MRSRPTRRSSRRARAGTAAARTHRRRPSSTRRARCRVSGWSGRHVDHGARDRERGERVVGRRLDDRVAARDLVADDRQRRDSPGCCRRRCGRRAPKRGCTRSVPSTAVCLDPALEVLDADVVSATSMITCARSTRAGAGSRLSEGRVSMARQVRGLARHLHVRVDRESSV